MLAIGEGRLDEGEDLSKQALAYGEQAVGDPAVIAYRIHQYTLCELRGRLDEIEPVIDEWVAAFPNRPFRELAVHLRAQPGSWTKHGVA